MRPGGLGGRAHHSHRWGAGLGPVSAANRNQIRTVAVRIFIEVGCGNLKISRAPNGKNCPGSSRSFHFTSANLSKGDGEIPFVVLL